MAVNITSGGANEAERQTRLVDAMQLAGGDESKLPAATQAAISNAQTDATQALTDAASAQTDATQALSDAGTADSKATAAQDGVQESMDFYDTPIVFVGDSITAGSTGFSRVYGYMMAAGPTVRALEDWNQGIGGNTIQQVIDRAATIGSAMEEGCLVDMQIGTNDITQETGDAEYFIGKIKEACNLFFAYGAKHVRINPIPNPSYRTGDSITYAEWLAQRDVLNEALSEMYMDNVSFAREVLDVVMTDDDYIDGTHLSVTGAIKWGKAQGAWLANRQKTMRQGYLTSSNLVGNPSFSGTSGSKVGSGAPTGDVPDGWTLAVTNMTGGVASIVSVAGIPTLKIDIPVQSISSNSVVQLRRDVTVPTTVVGDIFIASMDYLVEAGFEGLQNVDLDFNSAFESPELSRLAGPISYNTEDISGALCTVQAGDVAAGLTSIQIAATFRFSPDSGQGGGVMYLSMPVAKKYRSA